MRRSLEQRFWGKVRVTEPDECWEWTASFFRHGYGNFNVGRKENGKADNRSSHRVAYEMAHGPIPSGLWVLHRCDNKKCCNPRHLFLGTAQDNSDDKMAKGRHKSTLGENQWRSKLTAIQALRVRYIDTPASQVAIERGIKPAQVYKIRGKTAWKELDSVLMRMTESVVSWIHPLLPDRNPFDTTIKLASELSELQHVLHTGDGRAGEELADCLILLLDLCFLLEVDIDKELDKKMAVNRGRNWDKVLGTLKHIKER